MKIILFKLWTNN